MSICVLLFSWFVWYLVVIMLLMLVVILFGVVVLLWLLVVFLFEVEFLIICVNVSLFGVSVEIMVLVVVMLLEMQLIGVFGIIEMIFISVFGSILIMLQFDLEKNIDIVVQEVQVVINVVVGCLFSDLLNLLIWCKVNLVDSLILVFSVVLVQMLMIELSDLVESCLVCLISQISGVFEVNIVGQQCLVICIQVQLECLVVMGMILFDLCGVVQNVSFNQVKGVLMGEQCMFIFEVNDQLFDVQDYCQLVVVYWQGLLVMLGDVV